MEDKNKTLIEKLKTSYMTNGMESFILEWNGTRVPEEVKFPEGVTRKVQYMRDGMLLFRDNTSAIYERLEDDFPKQPQSIIIGYKP